MTAVTRTVDEGAKTLRIAANDLRRLLRPVMPLVSEDPSAHPALASVLIETRRGSVTASATDRFRAGMSRLPNASEPGFRVVIPRAELDALCGIFIPEQVTSPGPELTLTVDGERLTVTTNATAELVDATATFAVEPGGNFPNVDGLLHKALSHPPSDSPVDVNARRLAGFRWAGDPLQEHHLELRSAGKIDPVLIIGGDEFIGLLMPIKLAAYETDRATPAEEWTEFLAPEEPSS